MDTDNSYRIRKKKNIVRLIITKKYESISANDKALSVSSAIKKSKV